jgi:hypothetical protein
VYRQRKKNLHCPVLSFSKSMSRHSGYEICSVIFVATTGYHHKKKVHVVNSFV